MSCCVFLAAIYELGKIISKFSRQGSFGDHSRSGRQAEIQPLETGRQSSDRILSHDNIG